MSTERGENARAFTARGIAMKQRPSIYIPERTEDEYAFMDRPLPPRKYYGKSQSEPGRICRCCREFLSGPPTACPHCGAKP